MTGPKHGFSSCARKREIRRVRESRNARTWQSDSGYRDDSSGSSGLSRFSYTSATEFERHDDPLLFRFAFTTRRLSLYRIHRILRISEGIFMAKANTSDLLRSRIYQITRNEEFFRKLYFGRKGIPTSSKNVLLSKCTLYCNAVKVKSFSKWSSRKKLTVEDCKFDISRPRAWTTENFIIPHTFMAALGFTGSTTYNLIIVAPEFFAKLLFKRQDEKRRNTAAENRCCPGSRRIYNRGKNFLVAR